MSDIIRCALEFTAGAVILAMFLVMWSFVGLLVYSAIAALEAAGWKP